MKNHKFTKMCEEFQSKIDEILMVSQIADHTEHKRYEEESHIDVDYILSLELSYQKQTPNHTPHKKHHDVKKAHVHNPHHVAMPNRENLIANCPIIKEKYIEEYIEYREQRERKPLIKSLVYSLLS